MSKAAEQMPHLEKQVSESHPGEMACQGVGYFHLYLRDEEWAAQEPPGFGLMNRIMKWQEEEVEERIGSRIKTNTELYKQKNRGNTRKSEKILPFCWFFLEEAAPHTLSCPSWVDRS